MCVICGSFEATLLILMLRYCWKTFFKKAFSANELHNLKAKKLVLKSTLHFVCRQNKIVLQAGAGLGQEQCLLDGV